MTVSQANIFSFSLISLSLARFGVECGRKNRVDNYFNDDDEEEDGIYFSYIGSSYLPS